MPELLLGAGSRSDRADRADGIMQTPTLPYVYTLVDPRDGRIFYVGKGRNKRAWAHERAVRMGRENNAQKREVILAIVSAGLSVSVMVVSEHLTDDMAFEAEKALIEKIGLSNLTNLVPGGGGYPLIQTSRVDWEYVLLNSWGLMKRIRRASSGFSFQSRLGFFGTLIDLYLRAERELGEERAKHLLAQAAL